MYIYIRSSNNPHMRAYYIKYCKILYRVIKEAKRQHYCRLIAKSDFKIKTTWTIIKHETGKLHWTEQMPSVGCEVFTAVVMKSIIFWDIKPLFAGLLNYS
jgi:hypothetical protein